MNEGPAWHRERRASRKEEGIYVEGEGEENGRGRDRWQVAQPKIWRPNSSDGGG